MTFRPRRSQLSSAGNMALPRVNQDENAGEVPPAFRHDSRQSDALAHGLQRNAGRSNLSTSVRIALIFSGDFVRSTQVNPPDHFWPCWWIQLSPPVVRAARARARRAHRPLNLDDLSAALTEMRPPMSETSRWQVAIYASISAMNALLKVAF